MSNELSPSVIHSLTYSNDYVDALIRTAITKGNDGTIRWSGNLTEDSRRELTSAIVERIPDGLRPRHLADWLDALFCAANARAVDLESGRAQEAEKILHLKEQMIQREKSGRALITGPWQKVEAEVTAFCKEARPLADLIPMLTPMLDNMEQKLAAQRKAMEELERVLAKRRSDQILTIQPTQRALPYRAKLVGFTRTTQHQSPIDAEKY